MLKNLSKNLIKSYLPINKLFKKSLLFQNSFYQMCTLNQNQSTKSNIPNDYKLLYVENIPTDWNKDEIIKRFQQIGVVEDVHIIKTPLGESTGKIVVKYEKIENLIKAIEMFKNKCPDFQPLKLKFFRKLKQNKEKTDYMKNVLLIKNLPYDVTVEDLKLIMTGVAEPVHIALPRDEDGEVRGFAYVYFLDNEAANKVFKFLHLRHIKDRQLYISYTKKAYDISDFRTRKELGIKIDSQIEKQYITNQIYSLQAEDAINGNERIEYLTRELRKLEGPSKSSSVFAISHKR